MYKNRINPGTQGNTSLELSKIVDGYDLFNSELLYKITKFPAFKLKNKVIKVSGMNPSGVSNEIYGDHRYSWILIIFNPSLSYMEYNLGDIVKYPELTELRNFILI